MEQHGSFSLNCKQGLFVPVHVLHKLDVSKCEAKERETPRSPGFEVVRRQTFNTNLKSYL